jgi:hypothetical protein
MWNVLFAHVMWIVLFTHADCAIAYLLLGIGLMHIGV